MAKSISKIKVSYSSLPPSERKAADYVLKNTDKVIYYSVSELADKSGVSDSTIIRFCKNIGFTGYQEFKLSLAQDLVIPYKNIDENINYDDSLETLVEKISFSNKQAISDCAGVIDISELRKAVTAITESRKVEFYGVGSSGNTCADAKYKFLRIGILCDYITDSHLQAMSASTLTDRDVVVGISQSGSTKDVVHSCKTAKEAGARVICITSHEKSPITQVADIKLLTTAKELPLASGNLSSKIAQLYIIDLLFTGVTLELNQKAINNIEKTAKSVINKLY